MTRAYQVLAVVLTQLVVHKGINTTTDRLAYAKIHHRPEGHSD